MINNLTLTQAERSANLEFAKAGHQRASVYELLGSCFLQEPNGEIIRVMEMLLSQVEGASQMDESSMKEIMDTPETLRQTYYDRFFVPFSGKYVPPIESAIRGGDPTNPKQAFGPLDVGASLRLRSWYEAVGFNPYDLTMYEPLRGLQFMDHIGFELAFMAYLCYAEDASWKLKDEDKAGQWRKLQLQFLSEHLSKWCDRYAEELRQRGSDIYSKVTHICAQWIASDLLNLEVGRPGMH